VQVVERRAAGLVVYDLTQTARDGDIHEVGSGMRSVWFKDPSRNIISLGDAT
jgi:hypothetical protein